MNRLADLLNYHLHEKDVEIKKSLRTAFSVSWVLGLSLFIKSAIEHGKWHRATGMDPKTHMPKPR